jgi:hypothetical protein
MSRLSELKEIHGVILESIITGLGHKVLNVLQALALSDGILKGEAQICKSGSPARQKNHSECYLIGLRLFTSRWSFPFLFLWKEFLHVIADEFLKF